MDKYDLDELKRFNRDLQGKETAPLADRKDAAKDFREYFNLDNGTELHLCHLEQTISWIINGSYGQGAYLAVRRLGKRMNRRAWLFVVAASLEWSCPNKYARAIWNELDPAIQDRINAAIDQELAELDA